jgi:D-alanine-D-alanine ligase
VETEAELLSTVERREFDMVWSALYYIAANEAFIGRGEGAMWVADVLDSKGIPYVGSSSQVMKNMLDKFQTHTILAQHQVPVPAHHLVRRGDDLFMISYPAFVKPMGESRSVGISDESVVYTEEELRRQVEHIERVFDQAALVEDFLPGDEFTTLVLGNGDTRECIAGLVTVEEKYYGPHKILRSDLRGVGLTKINPPGCRGDEVCALAARAAEAMNSHDHVRIDIKTDLDGSLKIMEVNGIPGLKPHKSWVPQLYTMKYKSAGGEDEDYRKLIRAILESACKRYGL